jgi:hypothetical protein
MLYSYKQPSFESIRQHGYSKRQQGLRREARRVCLFRPEQQFKQLTGDSAGAGKGIEHHETTTAGASVSSK